LRSLFSLALVVAAAACGSVAALGSGSSGHASAPHVTILATDKGVTFKPNVFAQDNMAFSPGTVTVQSGGTITFEYDHTKTQEPHTLTIVKASDVPKTGDQVENCAACRRLAVGHLKNPNAPPDNNNPIVRWVLDKGKPGLDTVGDSVAIPQPSHDGVA
jgi:plastocyanin